MAEWYTDSKEEWSLESSVFSLCYLLVHSERRCCHPPGERQATPLSPEKDGSFGLPGSAHRELFLQEGVGS